MKDEKIYMKDLKRITLQWIIKVLKRFAYSVLAFKFHLLLFYGYFGF